MRKLLDQMLERDPLHIPTKLLVIKYTNTSSMVLNKAFIDRTNAWDNLEKLKEAYWFKLMFFDMINETNDLVELKSLNQDLIDLELYIQELFHFQPSVAHIRFWEFPKCSCPRIDNAERWPTGHYIVNSACVLHGEDLSQELPSPKYNAGKNLRNVQAKLRTKTLTKAKNKAVKRGRLNEKK